MEKKNCAIIYNPVTSGFKQKKLDEVCKTFSKVSFLSKAYVSVLLVSEPASFYTNDNNGLLNAEPTSIKE